MQRKSILKDTSIDRGTVFSGMGKLIAKRLAHALHRFCNCRNCCTNWLFFSAGCGRLRMATAFSAPAALYRRSWESPMATLTVF